VFGINPYSKSPFIALGAVFSNTISEDIGQTRNFIPQNPGIATLSIAGGPFSGSFSTVLYLDNPSYVVQSNLLNAINENINVTENYIDISQFLTSLNEAITFADSSAQSSQFISNIVEPITVIEIKSNTLTTSFSIVEAWGQTPYSVLQKPSIASFAIAGSPFSGNFNTTGYLENPQYIVSTNASRSVTENVTITDTQTVLSTFLNSITENINSNDSSAQISTFSVSLTEPNTVDDVRVMNAGFAVNLNENSNLANAQSIAVQFVGVVFENVNLNDASTQTSQFFNNITEAFTILDSQFVTGWIKINDNQTVVWNMVNNSNSANWNTIDNSEATSWELVNNHQ
jgi:hypothetical protein